MQSTVIRSLVFAFVVVGLFVACGEGLNRGDSSSVSVAKPDVSAVNLAASITGVKTLRLTWTDTTDETSYKVLLSPNGDANNYSEIKTISADSSTADIVLDILLPEIVSGKVILQACNSSGCADSAAVNMPTIPTSAIQFFKASNTEASDNFGASIAISKDSQTLVVGATLEDGSARTINGANDNLASNAGAAYVYVRSGATWVQQAYLKPDNLEASDRFGEAVAISNDGNTIAVGASQEDSNANTINGDGANNGSTDSGAVYIFTRNGTTWTQQAYIKASNSGAGDKFGSRLDISGDGNTLAVAAPLEDSDATGINGNGANDNLYNPGAAYVFTRNGTTWTQQAYLKPESISDSDSFGHSLSISGDGNTLAIGVELEDSAASGINGDDTNDTAADSGAAYIFSRSGSTWTQQAYIKASNSEANDKFGSSVAISEDGNALVVAARNEAGGGTGLNPNQANNDESGSGAVYFFTRVGATWTQDLYLKASVSRTNYAFGSSVAIAHDGLSFAVGAIQDVNPSVGYQGDPMNQTGLLTGAVYVYRKNLGAWSFSSYLKPPTSKSNSNFAWQIAMSDYELAVSARSENSNATGVGGDQSNISATGSGAMFLY